jgi:hypothetical protein
LKTLGSSLQEPSQDAETKIFEHGVYPDRCGPFGIARMVA